LSLNADNVKEYFISGSSVSNKTVRHEGGTEGIAGAWLIPGFRHILDVETAPAWLLNAAQKSAACIDQFKLM
jgi:hypothetical protein